MSKLVIILLWILCLTGCKAQEQILVEPCARESITFDPDRTEEWKALLLQKQKEYGFSLIDDSKTLSRMLADNVFYVRFYDANYLDIDKGGYSISIDNIQIPDELYISVYDSKDADDEYCQKLAIEIKTLLLHK